MRSVSLIRHASDCIRRDEERDKAAREENSMKATAKLCSAPQKTRRSNSTSRLSTRSSVTLLSMYSRRYQSRVESVTQELLDTRKNIVLLLEISSHCMSYDEKRECEWDLFLVHGMLEFGYSATQLKQAISIMKNQGIDPRDYSIIDSLLQQAPAQ